MKEKEKLLLIQIIPNFISIFIFIIIISSINCECPYIISLKPSFIEKYINYKIIQCITKIGINIPKNILLFIMSGLCLLYLLCFIITFIKLSSTISKYCSNFDYLKNKFYDYLGLKNAKKKQIIEEVGLEEVKRESKETKEKEEEEEQSEKKEKSDEEKEKSEESNKSNKTSIHKNKSNTNKDQNDNNDLMNNNNNPYYNYYNNYNSNYYNPYYQYQMYNQYMMNYLRYFNKK